MNQDHAHPATAAHRTRPLSPLELILLVIFIGAYVFDFKSENPGGHWFQYVFFTASNLSFFALFMVLVLRRRREGVYEIGWLPVVMGVLLPGYALFGALFNGVPFGNFARLELTYVIVLQTIVLLYMMARAGVALEYIANMLMIAAVVTVIWRVYHTVEVQEIPISAARYRLSPNVVVVIIGVSAAAMFMGRFGYVLPLLLALYVIQLSSTRTYLVSLGALYLMLHLYAFAGAERRKLIGLALIDGFLIAVVLYLYSKGYFENWVQRFIQNETAGGDATLLTRLAEYQSQWDILTSDRVTTLFGAGLGSNYTRDLNVLRLAILSRHIQLDDYTSFSFGHSLWIYSAYYGGILGGWMLPFILVATFVKSLRNAFRSHRNGDRRRYLLDIQCNAIMVQTMAIGLFAHPFIERPFCVQFGAMVAVAFLYPRSDADDAVEAKAAARRTRWRRGRANAELAPAAERSAQ